MSGFFVMNGNACDCVTGERIFPGEEAFDTGCLNKKMSYRGGKTRFIKEDTIVWLAEQAGYTLTKRNARNSSDAKGVDGEDVSVGGGAPPVGEVEAGGGEAPKRRSSRKAKG